MSVLYERLAPVQEALAELEREYHARRRAGRRRARPAWAAWADLHAALIAVRAAQGRDARAGGYRVVGGAS